jgi:CheY-like chemotaxis protein
MVAEYLGHSGFEVETAGSLAAGRGKLAAGHYDALVLDLMLPDGDGLDLCRELRGESRTRHLPLLMLTARGEPMDRIVGLELGADDYLPKPFEPRELLARVKALLRRAAPQPADDDVLRFGRLEIDLGARVARLDGKVCDLTGHQFDLLVVLAQSPGPGADPRPDHGLAQGPSARGLRSLDRRPHLAHPGADRGRPQGAASRPHRARRRLRVRPQAGRRGHVAVIEGAH